MTDKFMIHPLMKTVPGLLQCSEGRVACNIIAKENVVFAKFGSVYEDVHFCNQ